MPTASNRAGTSKRPKSASSSRKPLDERRRFRFRGEPIDQILFDSDIARQHFNSSEKRLARTLLLLARYGKEDTTPRVLPKLSQETLAEMVGTTRSRVCESS